ncbi:MAG: hypothetical protein RIR55_479 [Bacteroidota bacterium]
MELKLYMVLLGGKPKGRHTEQHDVFFGIASSLKELVPDFNAFWPEAKGKMHVDGWREIKNVNGYELSVIPKSEGNEPSAALLFFINLGGYKQDEFEEFHYKLAIAAPDISKAIKMAKETAFYKHTHIEGAASHVDDNYGIDVDDTYKVEDILPEIMKEKYEIHLKLSNSNQVDPMHLGYFKFENL